MLRSEAKPLNPMLAQASSSTSITPWLRKRIKRIADSNPYLRDELDMLLKRAVDDELMALVRAPDCGNCHLRLLRQKLHQNS
jgi:hypothetical protein